MLLLEIGIGMIALALVLFSVSLIYRHTAGKRILKELKEDYLM